MIESLLGLERIYRQFDAAAEELEKHLGVTICQPGCGKCCGITVPTVYRLEAVYAISKALGLGIYDKMVSNAEGWLLERHSCAPTYEGPKLGWLDSKVKDEFYALAHSHCPFHDIDMSCSIHSGRPMVCQAYGVTHMPGPTPEFCPRPLGIGESSHMRAWIDIPNLKGQVLNLMGSVPDPDLRVCGLLPSAIFKLAQPTKYKAYIEDNKIASAKLIGLPNQFIGLVTQEQMEKEYMRR